MKRETAKFGKDIEKISYTKDNDRYVYIQTILPKRVIQDYVNSLGINAGSYYSDDYVDNEIRYYRVTVKRLIPDNWPERDLMWQAMSNVIDMSKYSRRFMTSVCKDIVSTLDTGYTVIDIYDLFHKQLESIGVRAFDYRSESFN